MQQQVAITETVLRDGHQSLMATRLPIEDMLPVLPILDKIGYYSLECWGGATFVDEVNTVITPGTSVDVVVTEVGIAINPNRQDLVDHFKSLNVPQFSIEELKEKAYAIVGTPERIQYGDKVVALIEYRDGSLMDVVYNV